MTAKITTLSEAIKTDLDAAIAADEFSQAFTTQVVKAHRNLDLAEGAADDLTVSIAPLMYWKQLDSVNEQIDKCLVDIIVRKKIHLADQDRDHGLALDEVIDELVDFLDELLNWFMPSGGQGGRLESMDSASIARADENGNLLTIEVVINWNRIEQGLFEAYFPLHYSVA